MTAQRPATTAMISARHLPGRLGDQFVVLLGPALDAVRRGRLQNLWLGPAASVVVAILALMFRTRSGHSFLLAYAVTRPDEAVHVTLLKLPLSMFAPAALLPFWFALAQVCVVYSLAQVTIGARRTLVVAATGHALATLSARAWVLTGPPIGVGHQLDHVGDAGPSVAVISLLAYLVMTRRMYWLALGLITYHAVEVGIYNGLPQREHLIGTLTGVTMAVLCRRCGAGHELSGPSRVWMAGDKCCAGSRGRPGRPLGR